MQSHHPTVTTSQPTPVYCTSEEPVQSSSEINDEAFALQPSTPSVTTESDGGDKAPFMAYAPNEGRELANSPSLDVPWRAQFPWRLNCSSIGNRTFASASQQSFISGESQMDCGEASQVMTLAELHKLIESAPIAPWKSARRQQFFKTKMCPWHLEGRCTRGEFCNFAHEQVEVRGLPDLEKTKMCEEHLTSGKCTNPQCSFAHKYCELRSTEAFFKTRLCEDWLLSKCFRGTTCRMAHGLQELRKGPCNGTPCVTLPGSQTEIPISAIPPCLLLSTTSSKHPSTSSWHTLVPPPPPPPENPMSNTRVGSSLRYARRSRSSIGSSCHVSSVPLPPPDRISKEQLARFSGKYFTLGHVSSHRAQKPLSISNSDLCHVTSSTESHTPLPADSSTRVLNDASSSNCSIVHRVERDACDKLLSSGAISQAMTHPARSASLSVHPSPTQSQSCAGVSAAKMTENAMSVSQSKENERCMSIASESLSSCMFSVEDAERSRLPYTDKASTTGSTDTESVASDEFVHERTSPFSKATSLAPKSFTVDSRFNCCNCADIETGDVSQSASRTSTALTIPPQTSPERCPQCQDLIAKSESTEYLMAAGDCNLKCLSVPKSEVRSLAEMTTHALHTMLMHPPSLSTNYLAHQSTDSPDGVSASTALGEVSCAFPLYSQSQTLPSIMMSTTQANLTGWTSSFAAHFTATAEELQKAPLYVDPHLYED